ncbi:hypothetical protein SUNI508_13074 [Seiridium unicorne]|uniref:Autophagy-related protein 9 n=1 Tax=Seiridium unicorne TaxID=138068 RepID=A0ABR2VG14_9PEZI
MHIVEYFCPLRLWHKSIGWDSLLHGTPATTEIISRLQWFLDVLSYFPANVYEVVNTQGPTSLVARQGINGGLQGPLSDNQWQAEVTSWWATVLAALQAMFVETARGLTDPTLVHYHVPPRDEIQRNMCHNQKVRSTLHGSFSMFALLFTYIAELLIIATSYIIEPTLGFLYRRRGYEQYKYLEWITNSKLQQQRLVHENSGYDDWQKCTSEVPVTNAKTGLGYLDLSDSDHPRIFKFEWTDMRSSGSTSSQETDSIRQENSQMQSYDQFFTDSQTSTISTNEFMASSYDAMSTPNAIPLEPCSATSEIDTLKMAEVTSECRLILPWRRGDLTYSSTIKRFTLDSPNRLEQKSSQLC